MTLIEEGSPPEHHRVSGCHALARYMAAPNSCICFVDVFVVDLALRLLGFRLWVVAWPPTGRISEKHRKPQIYRARVVGTQNQEYFDRPVLEGRRLVQQAHASGPKLCLG